MSVVWLSDKYSENPELAGNKGANLAKLVRFGYKVPDGFCVSDESSESEIKAELSKLPKPWVVRSSSSAEDSSGLAFPGIFETVIGLTEPKEVISSIKKVMASKDLGIVKSYANQNKINPENIRMAVIIQTMINPDCSGVAFSQNPISGVENVVIEANWGLGETLVDGSVSPDYFEVNRSGEIVENHTGTKKIKAVFQNGKVERIETNQQERDTMSLSEEMANKLALTVENIAKDFGNPQDIEWAIADNEIHILQARPITTL